MTKAENKKLLEIAKRATIAIKDRGDLELRNNDSEDFIEVPVWAIKEMLEEAYKLGQQSK